MLTLAGYELLPPFYIKMTEAETRRIAAEAFALQITLAEAFGLPRGTRVYLVTNPGRK